VRAIRRVAGWIGWVAGGGNGSSSQLTGAFYLGLLDGLLGVAGMMTLLVMK